MIEKQGNELHMCSLFKGCNNVAFLHLGLSGPSFARAMLVLHARVDSTQTLTKCLGTNSSGIPGFQRSKRLAGRWTTFHKRTIFGRRLGSTLALDSGNFTFRNLQGSHIFSRQKIIDILYVHWQ